MTRKIIQIASHASRQIHSYGKHEERDQSFFENIVALCDDGSLWVIESGDCGTYWEHKWDMLPPIPDVGDTDPRPGL
jgi:dipeptidase